MKLIIGQNVLFVLVLIAVISESSCDSDGKKNRLSVTYDRLNKMKEKYSEMFGINIDFDCVKNYLGLPQNENVFVEEVEDVLLKTVALLNCSNQDKFLEIVFGDIMTSKAEKNLNCFKWQLKQKEPTSKLVETFTIIESDVNECEKMFKVITDKSHVYFYDLYIGEMSEFVVAALFGIDNFMDMVVKNIVIKYGEFSEEIKKVEKDNVTNLYKSTIFSMTDNIIKQFQDDPRGFHINDTLNFYYNKDIKPLNTSAYETTDLLNKRIKLDGFIDSNCVKKELNLPANGDKILLKVEASLLIASAKSKCIKGDLQEFLELFLDYIIDEQNRSEKYYTVSCTKYLLRKLEPTSKLITAMNEEKVSDRFCNILKPIVLHYLTLTAYYESLVGPFETTTCGVITDDIYNIITYKSILIVNELDQELKKVETLELYKYAVDKLHKLADCVLDRVNKSQVY